MTVSNDDRLEQLAEAVSQLSDYVQLLINAVDELREEIGWGNRNAGAGEFLTESRLRLTACRSIPRQ